jgi:calpain
LDAGQTTDALIDMSGGLEETFDLTKMAMIEKEELWTILFQAYHKNSIMGCSMIPDPSVREAKLANGLVKGHAYTITKLVNFDLNGKETKLVRIRNPLVKFYIYSLYFQSNRNFE